MSFDLRVSIRGTHWLVLTIFWWGLLAVAALAGTGIQAIGDAASAPSWVTIAVRMIGGFAIGFWGRRVWDRREVVARSAP